MDFRILGPLEVFDGDRRLALGGATQRALLGLLLLHAGEVVSSDRLVAEVWGESGPKQGSKALQVAISRLRRAIEPGRTAGAGSRILVTRAPGYELCVERGELDLHRFEGLVARGSEALLAGDAATASTELRAALALWRGPPLADLAYESFAQAEIARLGELHVAAMEERVAADLELGRHQDLIAELHGVVERHPLRERPRAQLMTALYRSGRQVEALEVYRSARNALVEELGIEPGRELAALENSILRHDPALELPSPVAVEPPGPAFVGRDREFAEMVAGLDDAFEGRGRLCLLAGEPGAGKSRLADELMAKARSRGASVLVGRCWEAGGAPAYWPWVQALRSYIVERDLRELRAELGPGAGDAAQLLPELRDLFADLPDPPSLDPEAARFRLFDAIASFLTRAAAHRPIVLVLDDLHAADEPSLLLLRFVARELGAGRLLVVGAYRDVDPGLENPLAGTLAELVGELATRRIELGGLTEADVGEYVRLTAGAAAADPATVAAIHTRTEGNALFVDEMTRLLVAEGGLGGRDTASLGIPRGVRGVIGHRLRTLTEECREVLLAASVLGREFRLDALAQMIGVEPRETLELLDEALEARTVGEVPGVPGRLRFSHALVRDTLYEELLPGRRLRLHAQAGEAIKALCAGHEEPHMAELAHHFVQAAPAVGPERAVDHARRAGDRAAALLAYEEAARLYAMAIEVIERGGPGDEGVRCELLLALGEAEARGGSFGAAKESFVRAADLARQLGAADWLGRAALGYGGRYVWFRAGKDRRLIRLLEDALDAQPGPSSGMRAMLLSRLAGALRDQPVPERRAELTAEAMEIARRVGDPATLAYATEGTYASISWPKDTVRWLSMARELGRTGEELGDGEKVFAGHLHAFGAFMVRADIEAAEREFESLEAVARELRQPLQLWGLAMAGVMRALQFGRLREAERLIEEERVLGSGGQGGCDDATFQYVNQFHDWALRRQRGDLAGARESLERFAAEYPALFVLRCMLVSLYSETGEPDRARVELERLAVDDFRALEVGTEWFFGASLLSEACERLDQAEHAPRLYTALLPYGEYIVITHPEVNLGSAFRYLGLLASVMGHPCDAVRHLERALRVNEKLGFRPWAARTRADLVRTLVARGGPGDAARAAELTR